MATATGTVHAPLESANVPCPECGGELLSRPAFDGPAEQLLALIYKAKEPEKFEEFRQLRHVECREWDCEWVGSARRG